MIPSGQPQLRTCVWELTLACNARCVHCGSSAGEARSGELGTEEALGLIEELDALGCRSITFSGGEPLAQPAFLLAALEACRREGLSPAVDTCGFAPRETVLDAACAPTSSSGTSRRSTRSATST